MTTQISYQVEYTYDDVTVVSYNGTHKKDAQKAFESFKNPESFEVYLTMSETKSQYKYIYDEPMEEYPFNIYSDDDDVWEFVDADTTTLADKYVPGQNDASDAVLHEVQEFFGGEKYSTIWITDANGDDVGSIGLRIADHSQNCNNNRDNDYYVSVVIADVDPTADRFKLQNEFEKTGNEVEIKFTSNDDVINILNAISSLISNINNHHLNTQLCERS